MLLRKNKTSMPTAETALKGRRLGGYFLVAPVVGGDEAISSLGAAGAPGLLSTTLHSAGS
jgi:hypothetical protein